MNKKIYTLKHRFITVFTRACHWPVSWAGWIQSKPLHTISQVNANALESIKLCTLFERWYHLDCCFNVCLYFNSVFLFCMLFCLRVPADNLSDFVMFSVIWLQELSWTDLQKLLMLILLNRINFFPLPIFCVSLSSEVYLWGI